MKESGVGANAVRAGSAAASAAGAIAASTRSRVATWFVVHRKDDGMRKSSTRERNTIWDHTRREKRRRWSMTGQP